MAVAVVGCVCVGVCVFVCVCVVVGRGIYPTYCSLENLEAVV